MLVLITIIYNMLINKKYLLEWRNLIDALDSIFYPIQDKLSQTKINPIADTMVVANYWSLVT